MEFYELKITLLLKKDVKLVDVNTFLSKNLNRAMLEDEILKETHPEKIFKPYCVGSLYPVNLQTKIYNKNSIYVLTMRSIKRDFLERFEDAIKISKHLEFVPVSFEFIVRKYPFFDMAYTLTPVVISIEKENRVRYWTKEEGSLEFVKERIKDNLERKYFEFFDEKIEAPEDFIPMIEIQNRKPIIFNYKGGKIFTNKFKFSFSSDEISQKLANLAFGVGILEKNSLGFGFLTKGK